MNSAICTLYEGHYHHGVAALSNSLYRNGFRGSIYVGYRGELPPWAKNALDNSDLNWINAKTLKVADGLEMHFLQVETDYHLTNYKPDFMLQLWEGPAKDAEAMFYFDPDIVVVAPWTYFLEWVGCGIAVCEDVNSPLQEFNPQRVAWRKYFKKWDFKLKFKNDIYVNGGFLGLTYNDSYFLELWLNIQLRMSDAIGGLNRSKLTGDKIVESAAGPYSPFGSSDQDALNATIEASNSTISFIGKEGMGFKNGTNLMFHALGTPKPWKTNFHLNFINGKGPSIQEKEFWKNIQGVIKTFSDSTVKFKLLSIKICSLLSRFYKK